MYPNPSLAGQFTSPALTGALPTVPIRYPPNMIKTINNNHPITTMASPFFVDNLLQHQKAAVNFQSQFVNSQLQSYIQEQHHQFMMQQNQLRHQQALKYAANLHDGYMNNNDQHRKNSLERISNFSPQHNSRGESPNSCGTSPRIDEEEDDENVNHSRKQKDVNVDVRDENEIKEYNSPANMNGRSSVGDIRNSEFDEMENKEENSHSGDEEIYTEDSPSRSPINDNISSTVKSELRVSPNNYDQTRYYGSEYHDRSEKIDSKKELQEDSRGNKDDFQEGSDIHTNNDSDTESRHDRKILRNPCSNCGSFECNPFYPSCKNYGANNIGIRRHDILERRVSNDSLEIGYRSPGSTEMNGDERVKFGDKETHLDVIKRTNLDSGHVVVQKPVLKFSVSAILGDQSNDGDRSAATSGAKIGHPQDSFTVHGSGVFSLPGFPLAPIAKPIASRPPTFPPHLHSLLAHCRQHPYLTVGGNPSGPVFMTGGGAGAPFPWAGGARGKPRRGMMRRAVFSDTQRRGLERRFQLQKYISKPDRKKLAEKLGLKDSQVKIWFQNRRMKWRNSKERELLASGGSREQTLPNKNNPHPDLSDAEADRPKLSPLSPPSPEQDGGQNENEKIQKTKFQNSNFESMFDGNKSNLNENSFGHYNDGCLSAPNINGVRSYSLMAADDAMAEDYESDNGSGSDEEINVT